MCPAPEHAAHFTYTKRTTIVANFELSGMARSCDHPCRVWVMPSGVLKTAPHPHLRGCVPAHELGTSPVEGNGNSLTLATAWYPAELTWQLLGRGVAASANMLAFGLKSVPRPPPQTDHSGRPLVHREVPLRGPAPAPAEHQIGSLR